VYTSEQAHSSIEKGAMVLGFGRRHVRTIPVDSKFRLRPDLLAQAVQDDIERGLRPCCVAATLGTTSTTSVDPVPEIADICRQHGLWLHVDAAYAGSAMVAPEFRWALAGCERADSFVTNPHKWLLTPVDCSVLYTRRPEVLRRAFSLVPEYLTTSEDSQTVNLMDYGAPLGRRFRALKLWFVMRYYGQSGIAGVIRAHVELARELASWIDADEQFERLAPVPFSVVCFRYRGSDEDNRAIEERVNGSGEVFLSHTVLNGRYVLRVAIGNAGTTRAEVQRAWELVCSACKSLIG
jgi:aromatic-L-amino-acid decarboxylase